MMRYKNGWDKKRPARSCVYKERPSVFAEIEDGFEPSQPLGADEAPGLGA